MTDQIAIDQLPTGDTATPQPKPKRKYRISLGTGGAIVAIIIVVLVSLAIYIPARHIARQNVEEVARQLNVEIITGIRKEMRNLFERTEAVEQVIYELFSRQVIDIDNKSDRDQFYLALLRANPHMSWISFGYPNGDFFGANRRDSGQYRVVVSKWDEEKAEAKRTIEYFAHYGDELYWTHQKTKTNNYYAPQRSWFKKAMENEGHVWTDVYVFSSSRQPGINSAILLKDGDEVKGVISIAIELNLMSEYLAKIAADRRGTAFIANNKGELIAFEDATQVIQQSSDGERPALRNLAASSHPFLRVAGAAIQDNAIDLSSLNTKQEVIYQDPDTGERLFVTLSPVGYQGWLIGTVLPESDFLFQVNANQQKLAYLVAALIVLASILAIFMTRMMFVKPLAKIMTQLDLVRSFDLENVEHVSSRFKEIDRLSEGLQRVSQGLSAFRRYVPTELVRTLVSQGIGASMVADRRTLTVFFMDLKSFTSLTEKMGHRVVPYLSDYMSDMSREIVDTRGTIDKYIGDAIMAFWGAPIYNEDHSADACRAALQCMNLLEVRNIEWAREGRPEFKARIGINTGRMIVGNIGSEERLNYSVLGDPVNLGARLEGLNETYGTSIIIGQSTYELAKYDIVARCLDVIAVKGKDEAVRVYELLAMREEHALDESFDWIEHYERGSQLMNNQEWQNAISCFEQVIEIRDGQDKPSKVMIDRCQDALGQSLPSPLLQQKSLEDTFSSDVENSRA